MKKSAYLDEIRTLDVDALKAKALELRQGLMKHRIRKKTAAANEVSSQMRLAKKNLARVLTELEKKKKI